MLLLEKKKGLKRIIQISSIRNKRKRSKLKLNKQKKGNKEQKLTTYRTRSRKKFFDQNWWEFWAKYNKINKCLARQIKKIREKTQITNIRDKGRDLITNTREIKRKTE